MNRVVAYTLFGLVCLLAVSTFAKDISEMSTAEIEAELAKRKGSEGAASGNIESILSFHFPEDYSIKSLVDTKVSKFSIVVLNYILL